LNALNEAAARAEAARNEILDFGGNEFFPSEWNAADSLFADAQAQRRADTTAEAQESAARFIRAAEAFEAMREGTLSRLHEALEDEVLLSRQAAVDAGAYLFAPDFLLDADNAAVAVEQQFLAGDYLGARDGVREVLDMYAAIVAGLEALRIRDEIEPFIAAEVPELLCQTDMVSLDAFDQWDAGDFSGARASAEQALTMYSALSAGLQAELMREEVEELAQQLAPQALAEANNAFFEALNRWDAGNFAGAKESAENTLLLYLRAGAMAERQRALDLRANFAAELQFNAANDVYLRASMAFQMQWLHDAAWQFAESRPMFRSAGDLALQRRLAAEAALRLADERLAESEELAAQAEAILQAGGAE
jgi:hypothetical protein